MDDVTPCAPLRVLVAEDCPDTAETMALLLDLWGHHARTAPDGPSALEAAAAFRPEVILLDLGLPLLDGHEVARRLRAEPDPARAYVIAVTGYAASAERWHALEAGCDEVWVKPVDLVALRELLEARRRARAPAAVAAAVS